MDLQKRANMVIAAYQSKGKTIKDVAERFGVSKRTIYYWKSGERKPTGKNKKKLNNSYNYYKRTRNFYRLAEVDVSYKDGSKKRLYNRTDTAKWELADEVVPEHSEILESLYDSLAKYPEVEDIELKDIKIKVINKNKG